MGLTSPHTDISRWIWQARYRAGEGATIERNIGESWDRIANSIAAAEPRDAPAWRRRFREILDDFAFLPGGRIQAGAGSGRKVTLFNCFVMGTVEDSIPGIFRALEEGAITMQHGGGVGYDFSTLRPRGVVTRTVGAIASGPVSFMKIWDAMCATVLSTGARRGAMMGVLRCDHPDIEEFVEAKRAASELRHFNLSVLVTDSFMAAVRADADWPLVFPDAALTGQEQGQGEAVERDWPGAKGPVPCRVLRRVRARDLWERILRAAYDCAEPGLLFIDRINRLNNLQYCERIAATNPCGEVPLPAYGACDLGSINLARLVSEPFTDKARLDRDALARLVETAVRFLDDVIDASLYPLPQQRTAALATRRIGLGVTGLADALVMLGLDYDSDSGRQAAADAMRTIRDTAYRTSVGLAGEKGAFPLFAKDAYLAAPFVRALPADIRAGIASHGMRNSHLLAIAPAGSISLLAGNLSSGLEPIFAETQRRLLRGPDGEPRPVEAVDHALALWRARGGIAAGTPPGFVTATDLSARAHLAMQATLQPFVDGAISKTVNVPQACPFEEFRGLYDLAYDLGLKGCTVFRPNPTTGAVLEPVSGEASLGASHCCDLDREAD